MPFGGVGCDAGCALVCAAVAPVGRFRALALLSLPVSLPVLALACPGPSFPVLLVGFLFLAWFRFSLLMSWHQLDPQATHSIETLHSWLDLPICHVKM